MAGTRQPQLTVGSLSALPDFEDLFRLSPNAYMVLDHQLRYVSANQAYLDVTASRLEDLQGRSVFDAFPHDPRDANNAPARLLRESFERVLREGKPDFLALIPYRVPRQTDTGVVVETRFWSATHTPILNAAGQVAFILQHTVDVTELQKLKAVASATVPSSLMEAGVLDRAEQVQQANRLLDEERQHLFAMFMQAPVAVSVLSVPGFVFELANPRYLEMVGRQGKDLVGISFREVFSELPADAPVFQMVEGVFHQRRAFSAQEYCVPLDRSGTGVLEDVYFMFTCQPVLDARGEVSALMTVAVDVTESVRTRRRLEEAQGKLREAVDARDMFLTVASHELKTPLTSLQLKLQNLTRSSEGPEGRTPVKVETHDLQSMQRQVKRLAELVNDLLDVSRLNAGHMRLDLRPLDLCEVVHEVVTRFASAAERVGCALDVQTCEPTITRGDRFRLEQVVTNLLSNALKYGAGKPVRLQVTRVGARAQLVIQDQGMGIASNALSRIFEKFERNVSSRNYGGLGLGLYLTQQAVVAMGGEVDVTSVPGEGATFTVSLPLG